MKKERGRVSRSEMDKKGKRNGGEGKELWKKMKKSIEMLTAAMTRQTVLKERINEELKKLREELER